MLASVGAPVVLYMFTKCRYGAYLSIYHCIQFLYNPNTECHFAFDSYIVIFFWST